MQCPLKHTTVTDRARWSEFAESIRKDVERSFGILKKRFQFLKTGITWHRKSDIDNAVFSCVILLHKGKEGYLTLSYEVSVDHFEPMFRNSEAHNRY